VTDAELVVGTSAGSSVRSSNHQQPQSRRTIQIPAKPMEETKERPADFDVAKFPQMMAVAIMSSLIDQTARARIGKAVLSLILCLRKIE
jgi:hypothetical protein